MSNMVEGDQFDAHTPGLAYWTPYCNLRIACVWAKWGRDGLFLNIPQMNPFNVGPDGEEKYAAAFSKFRDEHMQESLHLATPSDRIDTVATLGRLCERVTPMLHLVADWYDTVDHRYFQDQWGWPPPPTDYRPDELIRALWAICRKLPVADKPVMPPGPMSLNAAISACDTLTSWAASNCDQSEPKTEALMRADPIAPPFIQTPLQAAILRALNGKALKKQPLADVVCKGDGTALYRHGDLKELRDLGRVHHKPRVGFFRPDAPPPDSAAPPGLP